MMYFASRAKMRAFAAKTGKTWTDLGSAAQKRWAVKVL